nr:electron transport complex subunit RsxC [Shewanella sp. Isolate11]
MEQIDKGTLWPISGGIHPPEFKTQSSQTSISRLPLADQYIVPIPQVGESCTLAVQVGDSVALGQPLTTGDGFRHLPVHSPVSGTIDAIALQPSNHASGLPVLSCIIKNDHQQRVVDTIHPALNRDEVNVMSADEIISRVQQAGIAGLGGAAFPTHIKLKPVSDIELLIINGVECEPYITSDDRLMQEYSDEIMRGIEIIHRLLNPKRIIIAIEDNKPQAIEQMSHALNRSTLPSRSARVTSIPTLYPSGGEKQLIQILTGQEVPSGSIPAHLGILVQNVGTAYSIEQAVYCNAPLIERVVTLTGSNINKPGNYWVPIGTPIEHLLEQVQYQGNTAEPVIIGGPMMGYMLPDTRAPLLKGSNCVLTPTQAEVTTPAEKPCIRCGECAVACPAQLLPQQLFWHAKAEEYDKAANYNLRDCIECGCCSYVCPSDIPLVEYYRVAKSALRVEAEEKKQAELAKQRFDSRTLRLEEEKRAREEKAKQAAARRQTTMSGNDKDVVAAAMARIKAKKAQQTDDLAASEVKTNQIETAKAQKSDSNQSATVSQSDKVAAAIARAKAKKAAQQAAQAEDTVDTEPSADKVSDKNSVSRTDKTSIDAPMSQAEKVAAAVARAKAKKAALKAQADNQDSSATDTPEALTESKALTGHKAVTESKATTEHKTNSLDPVEAKKAKIAAAVAKAKAKKLAANANVAAATSEDAEPLEASKQQAEADAQVEAQSEQANEVTNNNLSEATLSAAELKKAKIAAAVAKAKAKKQAKADEQKDH